MVVRSRRNFLKSASATAAALSLPAHYAWADVASTPVRIWSSFRDRRHESAAPLTWKTPEQISAQAIVLNPAATRQEVLGFGAAMTDSSCYVLSQLTNAERQSVLHDIFDPSEMAMNVCRTCIGASDYARDVYSFDESDTPDPDLKKFSIDHDKAYILPVLRESRKHNPDLFLFSTPWSPPNWMKPNKSMIGGAMRKTSFDPYARYFLKFLEAYKAAKLRQTIATTAPAIELIDFQGFRVFADASISTAILLLDKTEANAGRKTDVRRLSTSDASAESVMAGIHGGSAPFERFETSLSQAGDPWFLVPESEREITALMDQGRPTLKDIALVGQGMQTGENDAFTITRKMADSLGVPEQLLKPRVRNSDVDRYSFVERDELLLYLEEVLEYKLLPTGVRSILEQPARKNALMSRAAYERGDCLWWRYTWPLHQERYGDPRLICPYRASNNRFALDGHFDVLSLTDTTVIFPNLDRKESPKYWLGLLNSRTLTYRMRRLAKLTGAGMYEYFWNAVEKLPMRTIDFGSAPDVKAHAVVVGLVDELVQLAGNLRREKSPNQRSQLRRRFDAADKRLEGQVLILYGISEEASRQEILSIALG